MKIIMPLIIYHFVFFLLSMGWIAFVEGEGSEIFGGMLWFNIYYGVSGLLVHAIVLFISSNFSNIISICINCIGALVFLNLCTFYFSSSFLTVDLFSASQEGDGNFPLVMHFVLLIAIGFSQFVAIGLRLRSIPKETPLKE
jgi:hypothetical protein